MVFLRCTHPIALIASNDTPQDFDSKLKSCGVSDSDATRVIARQVRPEAARARFFGTDFDTCLTYQVAKWHEFHFVLSQWPSQAIASC